MTNRINLCSLILLLFIVGCGEDALHVVGRKVATGGRHSSSVTLILDKAGRVYNSVQKDLALGESSLEWSVQVPFGGDGTPGFIDPHSIDLYDPSHDCASRLFASRENTASLQKLIQAFHDRPR